MAERGESRDTGMLKFIAYLQIIGIILVVLGHSFHEYPGGNQGKDTLLYTMMHNFRMPLFMFVSGFLMVLTTAMRGKWRTPGSFFVNKVKRLLVPFAVLSIVTFVPRSLASSIADDEVSLSWGSLYTSLTDGDSLVIPTFWFLQASFLLLVVNYALLYVFRGVRRGVLLYSAGVTAVFFVLPFVLDTLTTFFSVHQAVLLGKYFALGMVFCACYEHVREWLWRWSPVLMPVFAGLWAAAYFVTYKTDAEPVSSMLGICMCVTLAVTLERYRIGILDHLIGANYIIFLLSWYCNVAAQQVLSHYVELPWWVYTVLSIVAGVYVPWLGYRYLRSHPHLRWVRAVSVLLGQNIRAGRQTESRHQPGA